MRHEMLWVAAVAAALAGCGSSRPSDRADGDDDMDHEERIALADVPAPAMKAARGAVAGIDITGCEREMEDGVMVYELQGTAGGKEYEVECTADGRVLEVEDADDEEDDDNDHDD